MSDNMVLGRGMVLKFWPLGVQLRGYRQWGLTLLRKHRDEFGTYTVSEQGEGKAHMVAIHLGVVHLHFGGYPDNGYLVFRMVLE